MGNQNIQSRPAYLDPEMELEDRIQSINDTFSAIWDKFELTTESVQSLNRTVNLDFVVVPALTDNRLIYATGGGVLTSVGNLAGWITGTANQVNVANDGDGTVTLSTPQDIAAASSPVFAGLTINGDIAATGTVDGVDVAALSVLYLAHDHSAGDPNLVDHADLDNILGSGAYHFSLAQHTELVGLPAIGGTGIVARTAAATYAARTITGTANQVNVANGDGIAGNPVLSTPQNIHAAATPTFAGLTVVNAINEFSTDGTMGGNSDTALPTEKAVVTYVAAQITLEDLDFAGDAGAGSVDLDSQTFTIAGTANRILTAAAAQTITLTLPQDIDTAADFQLGTLGLGMVATGILQSGTSNANNISLFDTYDDGATYTRLRLRKSDTDTIGNVAQTDNGDYLGEISFYGANGTGPAWAMGASIEAYQEGVAINYVPTNLNFETWSAVAQNANQFFMRYDGNSGFGTVTPVSQVEIYDNTAHPVLTITGAHNSSYDPQIHFRTDAAPTVKWAMGVDAATDNFILTPTAAGVAGQTHFVGDVNGNFGINVAPSAAYKLRVRSQPTNTHNRFCHYAIYEHTCTAAGAYTGAAALFAAWQTAASSANNTGAMRSFYAETIADMGAGRLTDLQGALSVYGTWTGFVGGSRCTNAMGFISKIFKFGAGTIDNSYDFYCNAPTGTATTITNEWSFYSNHSAPSRLIHDLRIQIDNLGLVLGAADDVSIVFDGTDMVIDYDLLNAGTTDLRIQDNGTDRLTVLATGAVQTHSGRIKNTTRINSGDSPYTVLATDHEIFCDTDGGAIEIDLPAGIEGDEKIWYNCGSSGNDLTVDPNGAETIFGGAAGVAATFADDEHGIGTYNSTEGWR